MFNFTSVFCVLLFCLVVLGQFPPYTVDEFLTTAPNVTVCSSTNILADLVELPLNFSWTLDSKAYVNWTLESEFYPVLGSIECDLAESLIWDEVWTCNPNTTLTGDSLSRLSCPNPANNEVKFSGPDQLVCSYDHDTLGFLVCPSGSLAKSNGSGVYVCSPDSNYLAHVACNATEELRFIGGVWGCFPAFQSTDTLKSLEVNCTNGDIPKYIDGSWVCAVDLDTLGFTCPTNPDSRLQRSADGLSWICGPKEQDTFRDITTNCTGSKDTPFLSASGWNCIPTPLINNSLSLGTILFEWSVTLQQSGQGAFTSPSSQLQPYFLAYPGQLRAFQLRVSPTNAPTVMTSTLFLNGVAVNNVTISTSTTNVTGNENLGIFFTSNSNLSFTLVSLQGGGYVEIGVYAQINAD